MQKEAGRAARSSKFLETLAGKTGQTPPVWFMRQAGRYLPEYRALRAEAGSFLNLCFDPKRAAEATLQPVNRFDVDAAILFSDILVIPKALGQKLTFIDGEGPRLDPPASRADLEAFRRRNVVEDLSPIFETTARARAALAPEKALIGFAGAPWTVATYMLTGGPSADASALRAGVYKDPEFIAELIDILVEATTAYLIAQIDAGADALQLFDTWAGGMPEPLTRRLSLDPMQRIGAAVKAARPGRPLILFPRGVSAAARDFAQLKVCDAISIDTGTPWSWAREHLSPSATVQGGFDPLLVVQGGAEMEREARRLLGVFRGAPYVFNSGHGLTPETPPENVARLIEIIRE